MIVERVKEISKLLLNQYFIYMRMLSWKNGKNGLKETEKLAFFQSVSSDYLHNIPAIILGLNETNLEDGLTELKGAVSSILYYINSTYFYTTGNKQVFYQFKVFLEVTKKELSRISDLSIQSEASIQENESIENVCTIGFKKDEYEKVKTELEKFEKQELQRCLDIYGKVMEFNYYPDEQADFLENVYVAMKIICEEEENEQKTRIL
ncbi:hypothetical protein ACYSNR_14985 [Enterococcus sp. LJL128]